MPDLLCSDVPTSSRKSTRKSKLTCNDLLFLNEYLANGRNGVQAYRTVHPKASYHVAGQRASVVLKKGVVQAEIAKRIQCSGGITREFVESGLLYHYTLANEHHDYVAGASILMDCAKLAGFLIERRQEVSSFSTDLSSDELWAELQRRTMGAPTMSDNRQSVKVPPPSQNPDSVPSPVRQDAPQ